MLSLYICVLASKFGAKKWDYEVIRSEIVFICKKNIDSITKRLKPSTLRHFSTGSVYKRTSSYFLKWLRNVVLPAPMLPSMNTVNGALRGEVNFGMAVFITFDMIFNWFFQLKQKRFTISIQTYNTKRKKLM